MSIDNKEFRCIKCGKCCKAGYIVPIQKIDIKKWKNMERNDLLNNIMINPKSFNIKIDVKIHYGSSSEKKKANIIYQSYNKKKQLLVRFIENNHRYYRKKEIPLSSYKKTIGFYKQYYPVIVPIDFNTVINGLELGIEYIIKLNPIGRCPFLRINLCTIHKVKPIACKKFPYVKDNCLRNNYQFISIYKRAKKLKK